MAAAAPDLAALLAHAKPGKTIVLPAGTYLAGDLVVPAGVTLRGAGYLQTVINASGHKAGLILAGNGSGVTDLAVRGAANTGITADGAISPVLRNVKIAGNLTGLLLANVSGGRFENLLIVHNRTGAALNGDRDTALINSSLVDNLAIGMTVAHTQGVALFNNLLVNSPTAVYLTKDNEGLVLDHNFYVASFFGKVEGEASRTSLLGWERVSGQDGHSLSLPIEFTNPDQEDYHPLTPLGWSPNLACTSGWGTAKLAGWTAPATDLDGRPHAANPAVGAYETTLPCPRPPDGSFEIQAADGVKSAGLFDSQGHGVSTLFQNLPLAPGRHDYYLPARDNQNQPLAPGQYEVRVTESQLSSQYLGLAGNFATSPAPADNCSWPEEMFAFDGQDRLYVAQNAFENGTGVRAFDPEYKTVRWLMPGGGGTVGVATDNRYFYYLQRQDDGQYNLRKIDEETGVMTAIAPGQGNRVFGAPFSQTLRGMGLLNGKLYVSDPGSGEVYAAAADDPTFTPFAAVPGVVSLAADQKQGRLWALAAGGAVVSIDPGTGAITQAGTPVPGPKDLSACNGLLAILSPSTGKIHVFDASDPPHLKPLRTIGTGDGPYGQQKPDRFWFQDDGTGKTHKTNVAINSRGEVAVVDDVRVSFWGADGTLKRQGMGFWGQHNYDGKFAGDTDVRFWGISGEYSIKMDSKTGTWTPDHRWLLPDYDFDTRAPRDFFTTGGKNFGVYAIGVGDPNKMPDGKFHIKDIPRGTRVPGLLVVRMEETKAVPVSLYIPGKDAMLEGHDTNGDGIIDAADTFTEVHKDDGSAMHLPGDRYGGLPRPNGDLVFTSGGPNQMGVVIPMKGLDPTGSYPVLDFAHPVPIPCTADGATTNLISPYDYKTRESVNSAVQIAQLSDGGYASSMSLRSSGGTGLANGAGTDIGGFGPDGRLRWIFELNAFHGIEGVQSIPQYKLVMGMVSTTCDYMVCDEDGLGMGSLSMPRESDWRGMWSDHAQQQQVWVGNDGKPYYILGDYAANGYHWFRITGTEKTRHASFPVTVGADKAQLLAALPPLLPEKLPVPPTTHVLIPRLDRPMPIDGDLAKWRGITPAAIITPETGTADIKGPADCSAVLRLAYEGQNLYVQTIVFDDVVTFHQPLSKMFAEDGIEMGINSFMEGFKYNVAITTDHGPTVFRNKFVVAKLDRVFTNDEVPRSIKVYDDASQVEERKYIEAIYGVDLSKSKVIVSEFKLPLTPDIGLSGDPNLVTVAPGKSFWIGFFINDNDIPGGDVQKFLAWPATYGTFNVKEAGALATFN